ncbi:helix-turn-helix domain-containing protein [Pseudomonas sp. SIMBA_067]|uniref:helix-turn-helix domain-containing protein n=2 Tax=Pseudomonadota TaxID=1224 RepID=UPI00397B5B48
MTADIITFPVPNKAEEIPKEIEEFFADLPLGFRSEHCGPSRLALGWSVEALAFRSGVSPDSIRRVELGEELRRVTMQALAFALEAEGLIFFPGHPPLRSDDCRGATPDPKTRGDYHLIE